MTEADLAKTLDELSAFQKKCGIPHVPTQFTYELRAAISGAGPRASEWCDKPHRLVYDACRRIEELEHMLRTGKLVVVPDDAVERMAREIMINRDNGGCIVKDWEKEAIDNPHVAQALRQATAAIASLKGVYHAG